MIDIEGIMSDLAAPLSVLAGRPRARDSEPGKRVVAIKNVSVNEPFFQGHWPGRPIMPGVLIIEAMAQAAGVLIAASIDRVRPSCGDRFDRRSQAAPAGRSRRSAPSGDESASESRPIPPPSSGRAPRWRLVAAEAKIGS